MVNQNRLIRQQCMQMQKIFKRSREQTINALENLADKIESVHRDANKVNAALTACSIGSGVSSVAGIALAPSTFGASILLSSAGALGGYISNTEKGFNKISRDEHIKTLCEIAQRMVKNEIESIDAEKLRLNKLIVEIKATGGAAYQAYNLGNTINSTMTAMRSGQVSNASKIVLNSNKIIKTATTAYTILCIVLDTIELCKTLNDNDTPKCVKQIREAISQLRANALEIENQYKENLQEDEDEDDWFPYD